MSSERAAPALTSPGRPGRAAATARIGLGALFAATLFAVPQLADPGPVAAASCTGWTSQTTPPRSIKVLRTGSGRIETVGFRKYVAEVMASGEWPTRLHKSLLEAGAVVTKQYAWYHAMRGHHLPGYVRGGRCYDVPDDNADQLLRPDRAKPNAQKETTIKSR
mgnify:FL=1